MRKTISIFMATAILVGCSNDHSIDPQPVGKIVLNNKTYTMLSKDYQWEGKNIEINTKSSPETNELADGFKNLKVKKGDILKLEVEKKPLQITATKLNEDGTNDHVDIKNNALIMPTKACHYIYELKTTWDKGKETFIFDVDVE